MAVNTIYENESLSGFAYDSGYGCFFKAVTPAPFTLEVGGKYIVAWDGSIFGYTAIEANVGGTDFVMVGNTLAVGGADTGEKFAILYNPETDYMNFFALEQGDSHKLVISEVTEDSAGKLYTIKASTLSAIAEAIRTKTGSSAPVPVSEMAAQIEALQGTPNLQDINITSNGIYLVGEGYDGFGTVTVNVEGGALVKYVTFMNGNVELFRMPVLEGDNCKNPITTGDISTPTKESTAQENYTYAGWSLTNGGEADSSALQNVTEDRTVYAAYTSSTRYYDIRFWDGETLLTTLNVAYGEVPAYTGEKSGYTFIGWQPSVVAVTGEADYYAQWEDAITFAGSAWEDIIAISEAGQAAERFAIGDSRDIVLTDGTVMTARIAGFAHDDLSDDSGKAGMSIIFHTGVSDGDTTTFAWAAQTASTSYDSYPESDLYDVIMACYNKLPETLRAGVKQVKKSYNVGKGTTMTDGNYKAWAPSFTELGYLPMANNTSQTPISGSTYELYATVRFAQGTNATTPTGTKAGGYWTRTRNCWNTDNPVYVGEQATGEQASCAPQTQKRGVTFGFCI